MKRVCVFCGSSDGARPVYLETARRMGAAIAEKRLGLIYGGGRIGLMGAVADAALAAGAEVIGVIPEALAIKEVAHSGLTDLRVVQTMHQRKAMMADLSDAFIAMPGGYGTFEEFCEVLTWSQLSIHTKPCGLLNVEGYYDPFLALLDHATYEGFVRPQHRSLVLDECDPECLLERLAAWEPPTHSILDKWLTEDET
jgi:uncharacterized protein (TIGR00730 family)